MSRPKPDLSVRYDTILEAAKTVILQKGYDQITMADIAELSGLARTSVYECFPTGKEAIFFALFRREISSYLQDLFSTLQTSPDCDSLGGAFRATIQVINRSALLSALIQNDRVLFGNFLQRHPETLGAVDSSALWTYLLTRMQEQGLLKEKEIEIPVIAHLLSSTGLGMLLHPKIPGSSTPSLEQSLDTFATLLERSFPASPTAQPGAVRDLMLEIVSLSRDQFLSALPSSGENHE